LHSAADDVETKNSRLILESRFGRE